MADVNQIRKVAKIVRANPRRNRVVVSALGKRYDGDRKVTDLLILCHELAAQGLSFEEPFGIVRERHQEIARELGLRVNLEGHLSEIHSRIERESQEGRPADFAASRGEFLAGMLIAELLGWPFVDPSEVIFFDAAGKLDEARTHAALGERCRDLRHCVIAGFYGTDPLGRIRTFPRGGSDITGAIVARALGALVYENWTDVPGMQTADPRIVSEALPIRVLTFQECRELSYTGATVLHQEAVAPVRSAGIPINIRNTNNPDDPGTMIVADREVNGQVVVGVAGRKGFHVIEIAKSGMNELVGFGESVLAVLRRAGVPYEHMPSGVDNLSAVVVKKDLNGKLPAILADLRESVRPDALSDSGGLALLAIVGKGMRHTVGTSARLFAALADAKINVRMIDQGAGEQTIIVGVDETNFEKGLQAVHTAFFKS